MLVHKQMYWIRMNLQMLQPLNVFVTFKCLCILIVLKSLVLILAVNLLWSASQDYFMCAS